MEIHARQISVHGAHGIVLPPTSLRIADGQLALVKGGREEAAAFALALAGRLATTTGAVLIDGNGDDGALRTLSAVVDSPDVSEPEAALPLSAVLAEELDYAGRGGRRDTVTEWLRRLGAEDYAGSRFEFVPPTIRAQALLDIAAERPGVSMLVLDSPDRHSQDPNDWWPHALRHARNGMAVVVLCAHSVARLMGVPSATVGALDQPDPITLGLDATAELPAGGEPRHGRHDRTMDPDEPEPSSHEVATEPADTQTLPATGRESG